MHPGQTHLIRSHFTKFINYVEGGNVGAHLQFETCSSKLSEHLEQEMIDGWTEKCKQTQGSKSSYRLNLSSFNRGLYYF